MVSLGESSRRVSARITHRIASLPILALNVHTGCNCRCVMCDIWMANARSRELSVEELDQHMASIRRLRVQRVMLTGGEPLLHRNLWRLCDRLRGENIKVTLVTAGLQVASHVAEIAAAIDELVVSIDGPPDVHDAIRRVPGGFDRVERGLRLLSSYAIRPRTIVRSVVQLRNCGVLARTVKAVGGLSVDRLSFLAADVSSTAFNRPDTWRAARRDEVAVSQEQLSTLAEAIHEVESTCRPELERGFVAGGRDALWRIHDYYRALAGHGPFPRAKCNAPWVSAVVEPGGTVRPCFFHPNYPSHTGADLAQALNTPAAIAFRRQLDVVRDATCQRCVCTLSVPPWADV